MRTIRHSILLAAVAILTFGCGAESVDEAGSIEDGPARDAGTGGGGNDFTGGTDASAPRADGGTDRRDSFTPQEEEFLVREVAATDNFVFVPNSDEESTTVARIDGRDLSVVPIQVGLQPVAVRAADVDGVGSVGYVLSEGKSAISIVRADDIDGRSDPAEHVSIHSVPREINSIAVSPDGRHVLGYIDPEKPLPDDASVASLQVASLVRLGDSMEEDATHQLSVSGRIQEVEFTADGSQAFIVGEDEINRLALRKIDSDALVPSLDVQLSNSAFPPEDREVEVGPSGELLVVRSSQFQGIALYRPPALDADASASGELLELSLPEPPTDIDLQVRESGSPRIIASLPQTSRIALIETDEAFDDGDEAPSSNDGVQLVDVREATPGLSQITPDGKNLFFYSSEETSPTLGLLDLASRTVDSYRLRNQIRSLAVAPNSKSAVIVHEKQEGSIESDASALEFFRHNHGLTIFDMETGYRRPVTLQAEPASLLMTERPGDGAPLLFAMLQSTEARERGLLRVDISSFRTDTFRLPRAPEQIGRVAGKIFVSQESSEGRITFFDLETGERQSVSGYELNAGIE